MNLNSEALAKAKVLCAIIEDPDSFTNPRASALRLVTEILELLSPESPPYKETLKELQRLRKEKEEPAPDIIVSYKGSTGD